MGTTYGSPRYYSDERAIAPRNTEGTGNAPAIDKPIASSEELKSVLHVKKVGLNIAENTRKHHTDKYDCTEKREDDGYGTEPELVVRRGQPITLTVQFDRPFSLEKDDLQIILSNGCRPELYACTYGKFEVDESGRSRFKPSEWGSNLLKKEGNNATIEIHIPADCAIGHWELDIVTTSKNPGEDPKTFTFECPDKIIILFNPWCEDDLVYMKNQKQLDEYILNDNGAVFRGGSSNPRGKTWNFGQFEEGILDICLDLVYKCCREGRNRHILSDPIRVSRNVAQVVNCCDSDNGTLVGNWSGNYEDGEKPGNWYGSTRILKRYGKGKEAKPVKYGQCWVFSGLTTTVCRALGIPALSVTNYSSAHDTDENNTIEKTYEEINGKMEKISSDSVWNYHVWNQVWMRRPDIDIKGKFDGWQAIDATPQEESGGVFTCGPAPLVAIKEGNVSVPYDVGFVFAEVNGDEIHMEKKNGQFKVRKIYTSKIGKSISTKIPDGKKYTRRVWGKTREDVTGDYKHKEGSDAERNAVMRASIGAKRISDYYKEGIQEDVEFNLVCEEDYILGKHVDIKLTAENKSEYRRTVTHVHFEFYDITYDGRKGKLIKKGNHDVSDDLTPGKVYEYKERVEVNDYMKYIDDNRTMYITAFAVVEATSSRPLQNCIIEECIALTEPDMEVKLPESAKMGEEFVAEFTFENPLDEELTECIAGYEGRGFKHVTGVQQDNVPANGKAVIKFNMKAKRAGQFNLTFKFTSKQLNYLSEAGEITIV